MKKLTGRGKVLLDREGQFERGQEVEVGYTYLEGDRIRATLTDLTIDGEAFPGVWEIYVHGFLVAISKLEVGSAVRWMLSTWKPSVVVPEDPYRGDPLRRPPSLA